MEASSRILAVLAISDFKHDFSDKIDTYSQFKNELLSKLTNSTFIPFLGDKAAIDSLRRRIESIQNTSIYEYFGDDIYKTIPNIHADPMNENEILDTITQIPNFYETIQNSIVDKTSAVLYTDNYRINNRNYSISSYPTKLNERYGSIPYAFFQTSKKNTFIVLYDASFFAWETMMQNIKDEEQYTFYIIKNNEELADPGWSKTIQPPFKNITIKYLKSSQAVSYGNTTPIPNTYLYTNYKYTIQKEGERESATAIIDDKQYPYLSQISSVASASVLAIQLNDPTFFLLKRAGDWCQALSLLDERRVYDIFDVNNQNIGNTTIAELKNKNAEVALITHDRILLAYSLLLGVNVFYSMGFANNSSVWNVFFKNTESDILSLEKINNLYTKQYFNTLLMNTKKIKESILPFIEPTIRKEFYNDIINKTSLSEYFVELKKRLLLLNQHKNILSKNKDIDYVIYELNLKIGVAQTNNYPKLSNEIRSLSNDIEEYTNMADITKLYRDVEQATDKQTIEEYISPDYERKSFTEKNKIISKIKTLLLNLHSYVINARDIIATYIDTDGETKPFDFDFITPCINNNERTCKLVLLIRSLHTRYSVNWDQSLCWVLGGASTRIRTKAQPAGMSKTTYTEKGILVDNPGHCGVIGEYKPVSNEIISFPLEKIDSILEKKEVHIFRGGSLKNAAKEHIDTPYVNDESANFYTVTPDNIFITQTQLDSLRKELVDKPILEDEIYYGYRFLFYYLDDIYTKIFILAGQHGKEFEDDLYYSYLRIIADLFNIYDNILVKSGGQLNIMSSSQENIPMLPSNYKEINLNGSITLENIKKIETIYVDHRNTWSLEYLKNFESILKGSFEEMDNELVRFHTLLHEFVMTNYKKEIIQIQGGHKNTRKNKKKQSGKGKKTRSKKN